jgi:hypothetical protein
MLCLTLRRQTIIADRLATVKGELIPVQCIGTTGFSQSTITEVSPDVSDIVNRQPLDRARMFT